MGNSTGTKRLSPIEHGHASTFRKAVSNRSINISASMCASHSLDPGPFFGSFCWPVFAVTRDLAPVNITLSVLHHTEILTKETGPSDGGRWVMAYENHWLPGFNFNVKERDAEGLHYETLAICRSLEPGDCLAIAL
jgi:hypothetical protein